MFDKEKLLSVFDRTTAGGHRPDPDEARTAWNGVGAAEAERRVGQGADVAGRIGRRKRSWPVALPVVLGGVAVYLLLPRPSSISSVWGAALSGRRSWLAGAILIWGKSVTAERFLFYAFSGIAVAAAALLVTQRNPVHAALSFALVVLSTCGLFLLQAAPFLMAATTIIYAGAIVVTFLFVIMLAQQEGLSDADHRSREPLLSVVAGFVLLGALLYVLNRTYDTRELDVLIDRAAAAAKAQNVEDAGQSLGDEDTFFVDFEQAVAMIRGPADGTSVEGQVRDIRVNWMRLEARQQHRCSPASAVGPRRTCTRNQGQRGAPCTCPRKQQKSCRRLVCRSRIPTGPAKPWHPSGGCCSRTICSRWSWPASCCWWPPSGPLPSPAAGRRDCDEPRPAFAQLPGRRRRPVRPGHGRLPGAAQPDHHVPVARR